MPQRKNNELESVLESIRSIGHPLQAEQSTEDSSKILESAQQLFGTAGQPLTPEMLEPPTPENEPPKDTGNKTPLLNFSTQNDPYARSYIQSGYEMQLRQGQQPQEMEAAGQLLWGALNTGLLGLPEVALKASGNEDALKELRPKTKVGKIARYVGDFAGFVGGLPMEVGRVLTLGALKTLGRGEVLVAQKSLTNIISRVFGEKVGKAVVEGLPLATASALLNDEKTVENLQRWKEGGLIDELQHRLEAFSMGEFVGARFSWVAQTFDSFIVRSAVNVAVTQLTNAVSAVLDGRSDLIPPVEDLVYQSLLDIYFSKHREMTPEQIRQFKERQQELRDFAKWLSDTLELQKFVDEAKKVVKDPLEKGERPKTRIGITKDIDPLIYVTSDEVAAIFGKYPGDEPVELSKRVKYSPEYDSLVKRQREVEAKLLEVKRKSPEYKKLKQELKEVKFVRDVIEERALLGFDEANIWTDYWRQIKEAYPNAKPETVFVTLNLLKAAADNLGLPADIYNKEAAPGRLFIKQTKLAFDYDPQNDVVSVKLGGYTWTFDMSDFTATRVESKAYIKDEDADRFVKEVKSRIAKGEHSGEVSGIDYTLRGTYNPDAKVIATTEKASDFTILHETIHRIDDLFSKTGMSGREAASKVGTLGYLDLWEMFADAALGNVATEQVKLPQFKQVSKSARESLWSSIISTVERRISAFSFDVDYANGRVAEIVKDLRDVVSDVLGEKIAKTIYRQVRERQRLYGEIRQELDPAVYANKGQGKPETRAYRLLQQMIQRSRLIQEIQRASGKTAKAAERIQRKLNKLLLLQQRDALAISNLLRLPVIFDGKQVRVVAPDEFQQLKQRDYTKLLGVDYNELSKPMKAAYDFITSLLQDKPSYSDVISNFNNLITLLGTTSKPAGADGKFVTTLRQMATPLYSVELMKNVAAEFYREGQPLDLLTTAGKVVDAEVRNYTELPYHGVTAQTVKFFFDIYREPPSTAKNLIEIRPNPEDINALAEWILTPEFALRNFPEAQSQIVKLLEAHLVHFRTVEKDKAFFRDTLRFITKGEYDILRSAIKDAYKLKPEQLESLYGKRISEAAIKLKEWFTEVKNEIKEHLKELERGTLNGDELEVFDAVADVKDKNEAAKTIYEKLKDLAVHDVENYINTNFSDQRLKVFQSKGGQFLARMFREFKRALVEAVKGDKLDQVRFINAVNELRKAARRKEWKEALTKEELNEAVKLLKDLEKMETVSSLTTHLKRLGRAILRRDNKRVLTYVDGIINDQKKFLSAKTRRITARGKALKIVKKVIKAWSRLREIDKWGVWDYVTRIELGTYKVVNDEGHIILIRPTRKAAEEAINEYRKRGLIQPDEKVAIVQEYSKVDPLAPRKVKGLQGDPDLLKALDAYSYYIRKRLIVVPTINDVSQYIRVADVNLFPPNVRRLINGVIRSLRGQYYFTDRVIDQIASKFGKEPFAFSRGVAFARKIIAGAKLGYRIGAFLVNAVFGYGHTWVKTPTKYFIDAFRWMHSEEGKQFIQEEEKYIGIGFAEGEGQVNRFIRKFHPLWLYSSAEFNIRRHSLAANYLYAKNELKMAEADAREFARKGVRVQQFLYTLHALPRSFRGPVGRITLQFRSYMVQEMQFLSTLTPKEWVKYLSLQLAFGGPQALLHFLHSLPWLDSFGLLDKIERGLQKARFPEDWPIIGGKPIAFGIFGLLGFDISMAASIQLPGKVEEWFGAFAADAINVFKSIRDSINYGVRYGIDLGKVKDKESGLRWLVDKLGQSIVIAKYWSEALEAAYQLHNGDVWVRDSRGRKIYPLRGYYDVALLALGLKPVQKAQLQSLLNVWYNEQDRKEEFRRKVLNQTIWYLTRGKELPPELIQDMLTAGLSPEGIIRAWRSAEVDPETRVLLMTRYLDRVNFQERVFLRDLWESYLEAQQK